ncbi:MAG: PDZ domain-containing protein [Gammaproteobacteria bacterium]|nr:PDZ domain-containing protein [Gammaproteobacteria bacterium]
MRYVLNAFCTLVALLALLFVPSGPASAADADDAELRKELAEARKELNEAARRVGELTRELGEGFAFRFEEISEDMKNRAVIGVGIAETEIDGEESEGLRVVSVTPGGPADDAGVRVGDIILGVDSVDVDSADDASERFLDYLREREPGDTVNLRFRRGDDEREVEIEMTRAAPRSFAFRFGPESGESVHIRVPEVPAMPAMPDMPRIPRAPMAPLFLALMGPLGDIELVEVSKELGEYFDVERGLLVVRAPKDDSIGLRDGDVIMKIGDREPKDVGQALRILRSYEGGETVTLEIVRDGDDETIEFTLPERSVSFHWRNDGDEVVVRSDIVEETVKTED